VDNIIIISLNGTCSHHDIAEKLLIWCYKTITHSLNTNGEHVHYDNIMYIVKVKVVI